MRSSRSYSSSTSKHLLCRHITILYQESYGFERIQDLIKSKDPKRPHKLR